MALTREQEKERNTVAYVHRQTRDALLAETDWWAVADRTMTQAEIDYRQALRDITTHELWPDLNPDSWPTKP